MLTTAATALESSSGPGSWYLWIAAPLIAAALCAGFGVLGRRKSFVKSVLGTLALFGLAVWLNAGTASTVWMVLYGLWAAALAGALIRALRRPPMVLLPFAAEMHTRARLAGERRRVLLAAGLGLVVAVGGIAGLRLAAGSTLEKADAAQLAGDCSTAMEHYTRVEGELNEFTLSPVPDSARTGRFACEQTLRAERAAERGDHETAEDAYWIAIADFEERFGTRAPRLAELRLARGDSMVALTRKEMRYGDPGVVSHAWTDASIIRTYRSIVTDSPESPQAELVPARIDVLFADAVEDSVRRPCPSLGRMVDLVRLGDADEPGAKPVADKARAALPKVRYACGKVQYDDGKYQEARTTLKEVTRGPYAKKAADLLIAVDVADAVKGSAGALPPPATEGRAPAGTTELVITNDSTESLEVLYAGPENGTAGIAACATCVTRSLPTSSLGGLYDTCSSSARKVTIRLAPGTYDIVVRGAGSSTVRPYTAKWALKSGTSYSSCFYVSSSRF
ncbi:hypothetical protein [Streptomyces sp. NPDC058486]|uniref:hypothetical protein n=1 Tax=unclassified Streptomyces TaxID=2593676 RepID=UPI00365F7337